MKTLLLLLAIGAVAVTWSVEKISAARLAVELDAQRAVNRERTNLLSEQERLRARQPGDDELASLRRAAAEHARLQATLAAREKTRATPSPALAIGEWAPAHAWKNLGQATPHAAVETMLWAAAGGDVAGLKNLLSLTDATRAKADALLAQLPASERERYASPEDLIAAFTIKNIPLGEAQLVWFNETGPDDATTCVFLKNPPTAAGSADFASSQPAGDDSREQRPPQISADGKSSEAYLSLHRDGDDWRLVVPPSAVDRIAKDLALAPAR